MNNQQIRVYMSELYVAKAPIELISLGLGSCIGVVLYDAYKKVGGLAHVVLPFTDETPMKPGKYGNTAVKALIYDMISTGARRSRMTAKLFGGANMFPCLHQGKQSIGEANLESVTQILDQYNIPIIAKEVGGSVGRTIFFSTDTGFVRLKTMANQSIRIY